MNRRTCRTWEQFLMLTCGVNGQRYEVAYIYFFHRIKPALYFYKEYQTQISYGVTPLAFRLRSTRQVTTSISGLQCTQYWTIFNRLLLKKNAFHSQTYYLY